MKNFFKTIGNSIKRCAQSVAKAISRAAIWCGKGIKHAFAHKRKAVVASLLAFIIGVTMAISGVTMAILIKDAGSLQNIFNPATLACDTEMTRSNGSVTGIQVENKSDTSVYARVTLIAYYVDSTGEVIQGVDSPEISFTLNTTDWFDAGVDTNDTYYYRTVIDKRVSEDVGTFTANLLASGTVNLIAPDGLVSGLTPVLKAYSEVIQSTPDLAVEEAWGVDVENGEIVALTRNAADYSVEYYFEALDGTYAMTDSATFSGAIVGTAVKADDREFEGFTLDLSNPECKPIGTVLPNGGLKLKMYYKRNYYTVSAYGFYDKKDSTGTPLFKLYEANGTTAWVADKNLKYGSEYTFVLDIADGVAGNPNVTARQQTIKPASMTPDEGNKYTYTVTVGTNTDIAINGLMKKMSSSNTIDFTNRASWQEYYPVTRFIYTQNGNGTYSANTFDRNNLSTTLDNVLTRYAQVPADNGAVAYIQVGTDKNFYLRTYGTADPKKATSYSYATIAKANITAANVDNVYVLCRNPQLYYFMDNYSKFTAEYMDTTMMTNAYFVQSRSDTGSNPIGKKDFVATMTYSLKHPTDESLDHVIYESDATYGMKLYVDPTTDIPITLNRSGIRIRGLLSSQRNINGLYENGYAHSLGYDATNRLHSATGYDVVTETLVKKEDGLYIFFSGYSSLNPSLPPTVNKLIAVVVREGIYTCDGTFVAVINNKLERLFELGVYGIDIQCDMTYNCPIVFSDYGYSMDENVVSAYDSLIFSTLDISGDYNVSAKVPVGYVSTYDVPIPYGQVVKSLTVNGKAADYELATVDGNNYARITVNTGFNGEVIPAEIYFANGTYNTTLSGKAYYINGNGVKTVVEPTRVTATPVNGAFAPVAAITDANGNFSITLPTAPSYTLSFSEDSYRPLTVSYTGAGKEYQLTEWTMGGYATIGDKVFASGTGGTGGINANINELNTYEFVFEDGVEKVISHREYTNSRIPLLYRNYASDKFIATYSIQYYKPEGVTDVYPRIGFIVTDREGVSGNVTIYGTQWASTFNANWKAYAGFESASAKLTEFNGTAQKVVNAGRIDLRLYYDKGEVQLYAKTELWSKNSGDRWYLMYSGNLPTTEKVVDGVSTRGPLPKGKVAVAIIETSTSGPDYTCSNFEIRDFVYNYTVEGGTADDVSLQYVPQYKDASGNIVGGKFVFTPTTYGWASVGKKISAIKIKTKDDTKTVDLSKYTLTETGAIEIPVIDLKDTFGFTNVSDLDSAGGSFVVTVEGMSALTSIHVGRVYAGEYEDTRTDVTATILNGGGSIKFGSTAAALVTADVVASNPNVLTSADIGKYYVNIPRGQYTVAVTTPSGSIALSKTLTHTVSTEELDDITLQYSFEGTTLGTHILSAPTTGAWVTNWQMGYTNTQANSYDDLTVTQNAYNYNLVWSQPIGITASWGFTLQFDKTKMNRTANGTYKDNDVFFQFALGAKAAGKKYLDLGMNCSGGLRTTALTGNDKLNTARSNYNFAYQYGFVTTNTAADGASPEAIDLRDMWYGNGTTGDYRDIQFLFTRDGNKISQFVRFTTDAAGKAVENSWIYMGSNSTQIGATETDRYFQAFISGSKGSDVTGFGLTYKDFFYVEDVVMESINIVGDVETGANAYHIASANSHLNLATNDVTATVGQTVTVRATVGIGRYISAIEVDGQRYEYSLNANDPTASKDVTFVVTPQDDGKIIIKVETEYYATVRINVSMNGKTATEIQNANVAYTFKNGSTISSGYVGQTAPCTVDTTNNVIYHQYNVVLGDYTFAVSENTALKTYAAEESVILDEWSSQANDIAKKGYVEFNVILEENVWGKNNGGNINVFYDFDPAAENPADTWKVTLYTESGSSCTYIPNQTLAEGQAILFSFKPNGNGEGDSETNRKAMSTHVNNNNTYYNTSNVIGDPYFKFNVDGKDFGLNVNGGLWGNGTAKKVSPFYDPLYGGTGIFTRYAPRKGSISTSGKDTAGNTYTYNLDFGAVAHVDYNYVYDIAYYRGTAATNNANKVYMLGKYPTDSRYTVIGEMDVTNANAALKIFVSDRGGGFVINISFFNFKHFTGDDAANIYSAAIRKGQAIKDRDETAELTYDVASTAGNSYKVKQTQPIYENADGTWNARINNTGAYFGGRGNSGAWSEKVVGAKYVLDGNGNQTTLPAGKFTITAKLRSLMGMDANIGFMMKDPISGRFVSVTHNGGGSSWCASVVDGNGHHGRLWIESQITGRDPKCPTFPYGTIGQNADFANLTTAIKYTSTDSITVSNTKIGTRTHSRVVNWMRAEIVGDIWTLYLSADGKTWYNAGTVDVLKAFKSGTTAGDAWTWNNADPTNNSSNYYPLANDVTIGIYGFAGTFMDVKAENVKVTYESYNNVYVPTNDVTTWVVKHENDAYEDGHWLPSEFALALDRYVDEDDVDFVYSYDESKIIIDEDTRTVRAANGVANSLTVPVTVTAGRYITTFNVKVSYVDNDPNAAKWIPTQGFIDKIANHKEEWRLNGTNNSTVLFIGDSFMDASYFTNFSTLFAGKDAIRAGVSASTTYDWENFCKSNYAFLSEISPKDIAMHIGTNNIYDDGDDAETTLDSVQRILSLLHYVMPNTHIYWWEITQRKYDVGGAKDIIRTNVNAAMKAWCDETSWVTYVDVNDATIVNQLLDRDNLHPDPAKGGYHTLVNALLGSGLALNNLPLGYSFKDVTPEQNGTFAANINNGINGVGVLDAGANRVRSYLKKDSVFHSGNKIISGHVDVIETVGDNSWIEFSIAEKYDNDWYGDNRMSVIVFPNKTRAYSVAAYTSIDQVKQNTVGFPANGTSMALDNAQAQLDTTKGFDFTVQVISYYVSFEITGYDYNGNPIKCSFAHQFNTKMANTYFSIGGENSMYLITDLNVDTTVFDVTQTVANDQAIVHNGQKLATDFVMEAEITVNKVISYNATNIWTYPHFEFQFGVGENRILLWDKDLDDAGRSDGTGFDGKFQVSYGYKGSLYPNLRKANDKYDNNIEYATFNTTVVDSETKDVVIDGTDASGNPTKEKSIATRTPVKIKIAVVNDIAYFYVNDTLRLVYKGLPLGYGLDTADPGYESMTVASEGMAANFHLTSVYVAGDTGYEQALAQIPTSVYEDDIKYPDNVYRPWEGQTEKARYVVNYYYQNVDETYTLKETQTYPCEEGEVELDEPVPPAGYILNREKSVLTGSATENSQGELVVYYDLIRYDLTVSLGSKTVTYNGNTYDAYEFSESDLRSMIISADGLNFAVQGNKFVATDVMPQSYEIALTYNGKTYTTTADVKYSDLEVVVEGMTKTLLGGTLDGHVSFVNNSVDNRTDDFMNMIYKDVDSMSVGYYNYTYQHETKGTRYYIETQVNVLDATKYNGFVGLMPAHTIGNLSNDENKGEPRMQPEMSVGITKDGQLKYFVGGNWGFGGGTVIKDVTSELGGNTTNYKLGVYRNGSEYAIFVNDVYITTLSVGTFGESGFGIAAQTNGGGNNANSTPYVNISNFIYTFNEDLLDAMDAQLFAGEYDVNLVLDTDYMITENGKVYMQDINSFSTASSNQSKISVSIEDSNGAVVKTIIKPSHEMSLSLPAGTYTATATFDGTKADTTSSKTFTVGSDGTRVVLPLSLTDLGGSWTITKKEIVEGKETNVNYTYSSYDKNITFTNANSLKAKTTGVAYVNGVRGTTYYIEGTFSRMAPGWNGFVLNACDGQITSDNSNPARIVFAFYTNEALTATTLFYQEPSIYATTSWGAGQADGLIPAVNETYRFGVLRNGGDYHLYVDGVLWKSYTFSSNATTVSEFGVYIGSSFPTYENAVTDVKWTTDMTIIGNMLQKVTLGDIPNKVTVMDNNDNVLTSGSLISKTTPITLAVTADAGKEISYIEATIDGRAQALTYVSTVSALGLNGKTTSTYTFTPTNDGVLDVIVEYGAGETVNVDLSYRSAYLTKDGVTYDMYDISDVTPAEVSATLTNVNTGEVTSVAFTAKTKAVALKKGTYDIVYTYNSNEMSERVTFQNDCTYEGQISKAYLGGSVIVTADGGCTVENCPCAEEGAQIEIKSYRNVAETATSGSGWSLVEGVRNSVKFTGFSYVMQDEVVSDKIYVEAKIDTTEAWTDSTMAGLLVAHGRSILNDNTHKNAQKLAVGIRNNQLFVTNMGIGWGVGSMQMLADLNDLGVLGNSTTAKLGVARVGTKYHIYVNDVYVVSYEWTVAPKSSGVGAVSSGVSNRTLTEFNYSTNEALVDAFVPQTRDIDVYFIAGQSNASGYSSYTVAELQAIDERMIHGYGNMIYAGNSRSSVWTEGVVTGSNERNLGFIMMRAGLGRTNSYMGIEPGLAQTLSAYYNGTTGKQAAFIKYASGGTALLNNTGGENSTGGNWVSPSYATSLGVNHEGLVGGMYRNFIAEADTRIAQLRAMGYNPIVKGMYWMQGESDAHNPTEYLKAFKYFASDVRKDLTDKCEQDCSDMPIFIGEISYTFNSAIAATVNRNTTFVNMQRSIPNNVANTYVLPFANFAINKLVGGNSEFIGTDNNHWKWSDQLKMGNILGQSILDNVLNKSRVVLYEDNFDDVTTRVDLSAGTNINGWIYAQKGNGEAYIENGRLYFSGNQYDVIYRDGGADWSNYTLEADFCYTVATGWGGMLYNVTADNSFQKGGISLAGDASLNGQIPASGVQWVNNEAKDGNIVYKAVSALTVGKPFRMKIVTKDNTSTLYYALYDANGMVGNWTFVMSVNNIHENTRNGSIGFMTSGNGANNAFWVDNIKCYR